jgi:transcriptional regulator with XRE-family HTH domain
MLTSEQIRGARGMLRLEQQDLAERSGVSLETVKRIEQIPGPISALASTAAALQKALEAAGIEFTNDGQPGVRMRRQGLVELGNLRVRQQPGPEGAVVIEPFGGKSKLKIGVPHWAFEGIGRAIRSHEEGVALVCKHLEIIRKIASAKLASGQTEKRDDHGRPFHWIWIGPEDLAGAPSNFLLVQLTDRDIRVQHQDGHKAHFFIASDGRIESGHEFTPETSSPRPLNPDDPSAVEKFTKAARDAAEEFLRRHRR